MIQNCPMTDFGELLGQLYVKVTISLLGESV